MANSTDSFFKRFKNKICKGEVPAYSNDYNHWIYFLLSCLNFFVFGWGTIIVGLINGDGADVAIGVLQCILVFFGFLWSWLWAIWMLAVWMRANDKPTLPVINTGAITGTIVAKSSTRKETGLKDDSPKEGSATSKSVLGSAAKKSFAESASGATSKIPTSSQPQAKASGSLNLGSNPNN